MKLIYMLLLMFLMAQALGMFTGMIILHDFTQNPYVSSLVVTADAQDPLNALLFIGYTVLGAVVIVLVIRRFRLNMVVFRIMEFILIATSSSLVFYAICRLALGYEISTIAGMAAGLSLAGAKVFMPQLKNPSAILATAGVGVVFGISMGVVPVLIFLALLSIYDFLSVFITRHMVEIADYIITRDLAFTVTAKAVVPETREVKRIDLGTGDLIAPIMMEVSIMPYSRVAAVFVMLGSFIAMALFLTLVWKKKLVLPALPPIVLGMVAGLLAWYALGAL